jgi:5-methylcytosine-specific restriction endonuclease McrA
MTSTPSPSPTPTKPGQLIVHDLLHGIWAGVTSSPIVLGLLVLLAVGAVVRSARQIRWASIPRDPVRRFARADKAVILTHAGGRCERHGWINGRCRLTDGLEADHVHPHSKGGRTSLTNGQALCKRHNRQKSAHVPYGWELKRLANRRLAYYPPGVPGVVVRPTRHPGRPQQGG